MVALQQLLNGLTLGAVYTLVALGFSLVMGVLGVLNIAIAELFMLGGYVGLTLVMRGVPLPLAVAGAMLAAGVVGAIIERIAYRPFASAPPIVPLLSTLGCSIFLQNTVVNLWGSDPLQMPAEVMGIALELGALRISGSQLTVIGCAVLLVAAVAWLVQRTRPGRALRAVAENRDVARLLGVPARRIVGFAFIVSGMLAGAAGLLIGLHYSAVHPFIGVEVGLKAVAVMVIGGVTRIWGVLLAGPLVGVAEVMSIYLGGSAVRDFVVYGLMIATLLLRPQGLLGKPPEQEGGARLMSSYLQGLFADVGIGVLGGLSVYVILAVGQLSLGNAAFMAVGAYVAAMLTVWQGWPLTPALIAAALASGLLGFIVGFPALRLRGIYLAVASLGFGEMTRSFFLRFPATGGAEGFRGMQHVSVEVIWLWTAGVLIALLLFERSRLWLEFRAVRDDEKAADMAGLDTTRLKLMAFTLSAMIGGLAGGLFAHHHVFIEPSNFGFERSVDLVLVTILGGSETALGALAGALILELLPEGLRFAADWRLAVFGALLLVILLVRRQGLLDRAMFSTLRRVLGSGRG